MLDRVQQQTMYASFDTVLARLVHRLGQFEWALAPRTLQERRCALIKQPSHNFRPMKLYCQVQQRFAAEVNESLKQNVPGRYFIRNTYHIICDHVFMLDTGTHEAASETHHNVSTAVDSGIAGDYIKSQQLLSKLQRCASLPIAESTRERTEGGVDEKQIHRSEAIQMNCNVQGR